MLIKRGRGSTLCVSRRVQWWYSPGGARLTTSPSTNVAPSDKSIETYSENKTRELLWNGPLKMEGGLFFTIIDL